MPASSITSPTAVRSTLPAAFISGIHNLGFVAGVGLVGMWLALERLLSQVKSRSLDPLLLWLGLDFVVEVVLSGLSGLNYPHYFMCWLPWISGRLRRCSLSGSSPLPRNGFRRFSLPVLLAAILALSLASLNTLAVYAGAFGRLAARPRRCPALGAAAPIRERAHAAG